LLSTRWLAVVIVGFLTGCLGRADAVPIVAELRAKVLAELPHDSSAYTEGLEFDGDVLWESTGKPGQSQLRQLDPANSSVRRAVSLPHDYFGEGITVVGDRIWQVTYRDNVAIEWDKAVMTPLREVRTTGEGWGLCWDGNRLIRSDGSDRLHFHTTADFGETGSIAITRDGLPLAGLNELECVNGQVWANVWPTDEIVRVDPAAGVVNAAVDASGLLPNPRTQAQVLNGIAHLGGDEFLLTGKYWPSAFRVRFDTPT
jgi:glutaminyl-peptide cyclotransferase